MSERARGGEAGAEARRGTRDPGSGRGERRGWDFEPSREDALRRAPRARATYRRGGEVGVELLHVDVGEAPVRRRVRARGAGGHPASPRRVVRLHREGSAPSRTLESERAAVGGSFSDVPRRRESTRARERGVFARATRAGSRTVRRGRGRACSSRDACAKKCERTRERDARRARRRPDSNVRGGGPKLFSGFLKFPPGAPHGSPACDQGDATDDGHRGLRDQRQLIKVGKNVLAFHACPSFAFFLPTSRSYPRATRARP